MINQTVSASQRGGYDSHVKVRLDQIRKLVSLIKGLYWELKDLPVEELHPLNEKVD